MDTAAVRAGHSSTAGLPALDRDPAQADNSAAGERHHRTATAEMQVQTDADPTEEPTWSRFDLGRALRLLHMPSEGVVRRTVRMLHIRFWHCSAQRLRELMKLGGAPQRALDMVQAVTDSCRACRNWTRPGPRSITRTRLAQHFNEMVQWDILFLYDDAVSHCLDEAIRLTRVAVLPSKTAESIISTITRQWLRHYGPMKYLTADGESGLSSSVAAAWADRHSIELRIKPVGAHAQIVERHHELYRQLVHKVRDQLQREGIELDKEDLYAECEYVKNCTESIGYGTGSDRQLPSMPQLDETWATIDYTNKVGPTLQRDGSMGHSLLVR